MHLQKSTTLEVDEIGHRELINLSFRSNQRKRGKKWRKGKLHSLVNQCYENFGCQYKSENVPGGERMKVAIG